MNFKEPCLFHDKFKSTQMFFCKSKLKLYCSDDIFLLNLKENTDMYHYLISTTLFQQPNRASLFSQLAEF